MFNETLIELQEQASARDCYLEVEFHSTSAKGTGTEDDPYTESGEFTAKFIPLPYGDIEYDWQSFMEVEEYSIDDFEAINYQSNTNTKVILQSDEPPSKFNKSKPKDIII